MDTQVLTAEAQAPSVALPLTGDFSYWELKQYFNDVDFTVIGAGIVGLNCALQLRKRYPKSKILVLERSLLPKGASTKNAGFACFGSASELLDDMNLHTEDEMVHLVRKRYHGIKLLRKQLGDKAIGFRSHGGYELFIKGDPEFFEACLENRKRLNKLLYPVFRKKVFTVHKNDFGFANIQDHLICHRLEGQIDTGKMMHNLWRKSVKKGIIILNGIELKRFEDQSGSVALETDRLSFKTRKLFLATNGFASSLTGEPVKPARAQVLITKPLEKMPFKGTFHIDKGFYYFRNIDNRVLLGGGRNLDFKGEETAEFGLTERIQQQLEHLLRTVILPDTPVEIEHRWSGIMGVGEEKSPIVKALSDNVYCGVRLGGMGVALGSQTGKDLSDLL